MIVTIDKLNKVGDEVFESIIKTLLTIIIGPGIIPFSKGKDGGREAVFNGSANYPSKKETKTGKWIFQVKYCDLSLGITEARSRIKSHINSELKKLEKYEYIKNNECDNYIFITNVPFSGVAKIGLHDYMAKKRQKYKIKFFDYWDGEKVTNLINSIPEVKDSYFSIKGIITITKSEIDNVVKVYVPPNGYENIKEKLFSDNVVAIVGQAHVGKTITSKYLSNELFNKKSLNGIFYVPVIDFVERIPSVINSIIIFDDLFGDIKYEDIGKMSKIVTSLSKNNYIIITSRDYIYTEAKNDLSVIGELVSEAQFLIQEGSYSTIKLENILVNHLENKKVKIGLNEDIVSFLKKNKSVISNELRFPHNIAILVDNLDNTINTKSKLLDLVRKSKKIEKVIINWINYQSDENKKIILLCSIFRPVQFQILADLAKELWSFSPEQIEKIINYNDRILTIKERIVNYTHPSFKATIIKFFKSDKRELLEKVFFQIFLKNKLPIRHQKYITGSFIEIVKYFDIEILIKILNSKILNKNMHPIIWSQLIKRDYKYAIDFFLIEDQKLGKQKPKRKYMISFVKAKDSIKKNDVINIIDYLFKMRDKQNYKLIDTIILYYSYRIIDNLDQYINKLDEYEQSTLKLKIGLLAVKGIKYPYDVLTDLVRLSNHQSARIRRKVYSSINVISKGIKHDKNKIFRECLNKEKKN